MRVLLLLVLGVFWLIYCILEEITMYIFAKFHRVIFILIIFGLFCFMVSPVEAAEEDGLLHEGSCVYKEVHSHCYYLIIEGEHYLAIKNKGDIVAVYGLKDGVVVLVWEAGTHI